MAGIGFERVWRAYGRLGNKQASKRAFDAIPDPDVDHIADRAAAWAASAKTGQRRMPLERWLQQERYDEADRRVKPRANAADMNGTDGEEDCEVGKRDAVDASASAEAARAIRRAAIEINVPCNVLLKVQDAKLERRGEDTWLFIATDSGNVAVLVEGGNGKAFVQEEGQAHLGRLGDACGAQIESEQDLFGRTFMIVDGTFAAPLDAAA